MLKKFTNKKGFSLMEMLIVVAIIAILVAIAIPTFSGALNKARASTDLANIRSGYASAQIAALTDTEVGTFYLKKDGTVEKATTAPGDAYKCQGASSALTAAEVGGKYTVTWAKDDYITYTVTAGTGDGLASVTAIAKSTT